MLYSETFKHLLKNEVLQQIKDSGRSPKPYLTPYIHRFGALTTLRTPNTLQEADVWIDTLLTHFNHLDDREGFCYALNGLLEWVITHQTFDFWSNIYDGIQSGLNLTWFGEEHLVELILVDFDDSAFTSLWNHYCSSPFF